MNCKILTDRLIECLGWSKLEFGFTFNHGYVVALTDVSSITNKRTFNQDTGL